MALKKDNYIIDEGSAHIWSLNLLEDNLSLSGYYNLLSVQEKEKADKFRFDKDRNMYIFSHGVLRILASRYMPVNPSEVSYSFGPFGKPYFHPKSELSFNLSHSAEMALIVFTKNIEIGVDIEKISEATDILEIAETVYTKDEINTLKTMPGDSNKLSHFFELWTRKEAYIKGLGYGLSMPVSLTDISVLSEEVTLLSNENNELKKEGSWIIRSLESEKHYKAAIASNKGLSKLQHFKWEG